MITPCALPFSLFLPLSLSLGLSLFSDFSLSLSLSRSDLHVWPCTSNSSADRRKEEPLWPPNTSIRRRQLLRHSPVACSLCRKNVRGCCIGGKLFGSCIHTIRQAECGICLEVTVCCVELAFTKAWTWRYIGKRLPRLELHSMCPNSY